MLFRLIASVRQEKILSPHEESNLRPSDSPLQLLTLSHRDSVAIEVYNEVHITTKIYSLGLNFTNICAYIFDFFGFKVILMHVV